MVKKIMEYLLKKYNHPLKFVYRVFPKIKKIRPEESFKMCSCKMDLSKVKIYLCLKILNKKIKCYQYQYWLVMTVLLIFSKFSKENIIWNLKKTKRTREYFADTGSEDAPSLGACSTLGTALTRVNSTCSC